MSMMVSNRSMTMIRWNSRSTVERRSLLDEREIFPGVLGFRVLLEEQSREKSKEMVTWRVSSHSDKLMRPRCWSKSACSQLG